MRIHYDEKLDALWFRATDNDHIMVKVDAKGEVLGFSILNVRGFTEKPLQVSL